MKLTQRGKLYNKLANLKRFSTTEKKKTSVSPKTPEVETLLTELQLMSPQDPSLQSKWLEVFESRHKNHSGRGGHYYSRNSIAKD